MSHTHHHGSSKRRMCHRGHGRWHHLMTERPNRRKTKMLEHDVRRAHRHNDGVRDWPVPKKPHVYFW